MSHGLGTWNPQIGTWEPDDDVYVCSKCEATSTDEDFLTEVQLELLCPDCLEETAQCFSCQKLFELDNLTEEDGNLFCEDCLVEKMESV